MVAALPEMTRDADRKELVMPIVKIGVHAVHIRTLVPIIKMGRGAAVSRYTPPKTYGLAALGNRAV